MNLGKNIAIIGAGPAGLAAAEALAAIGYKNITIFEKKPEAGGMVVSGEDTSPDGTKRIYEVGAIQPTGSKHLYNLLAKYQLKLTENVGILIYSLDEHRIIFNSKEPHKNKRPERLKRIATLFKLGRSLFKYRRLLKPGYNHFKFNKELSINYIDWVEAQRFGCYQHLFGIAGAYCTFAVPSRPVPTIYVIKGMFTFLKKPQRYVNGKSCFVEEGYQKLWKQVAKQHCVHFQEPILKIKRDTNTVTAVTSKRQVQFESIIIACNPLSSQIDGLSQIEHTIFSKVNYSPGYRFVCEAEGLSMLTGNVIIKEPSAGEKIYDPGEVTGIWPCFPYIQGGRNLFSGAIQSERKITPDEVKLIVQQFIEKLDGKLIRWIRIKYFPFYSSHFSGTDIQNNIYDQFENLQGTNNTYYTGDILCGSGNARAIDYSYDLVNRFF